MTGDGLRYGAAPLKDI